MRKNRCVWTAACLFMLAGAPASAYVLEGYHWPNATATFYVSIAAPNQSDIWNSAFEYAMGEWNGLSNFEYRIVRNTYYDPCADPNTSGVYENGVGFSSTDCGDSWGSTTLAETHSWYINKRFAQTGIVFNANDSWNVYSGPFDVLQWTGIYDFRRVAAHELGHALGLGHEDSKPSIMSTYVADGSDIEYPQPDDIDGEIYLYGAATSFPDLVVVSPGVSDATLNAGQGYAVSATVQNIGSGTSSATNLRFYLSSDSVISSSDLLLGSVPVLDLAGSGQSPQTLNVTAPGTAGTWWVGACVDPVNGESSVANNCSAAAAITVYPAPVLSGTPTNGTTSSDGDTDLTNMLLIIAAIRNTGTELLSGQTVSGSVGTGGWTYYRIVPTSGATGITVTLTGLSNNVDLYLGVGSPPTLNSYDCRSSLAGTANESCSLSLTSTTTVYIGAYGYQGGSYTLDATLSGN